MHRSTINQISEEIRDESSRLLQDESSPLLKVSAKTLRNRKKKQRKRKSTKDKAILKDGLKYAKDHPFALVAALILSGPSAINSFMNPFNISAKDFTAATWNAADSGKKAMGIINSFSSELVNGIMNTSFNAEAITNLSKSFKACFDRTKTLAENLATFIANILYNAGGVMGAMPTAAIAFASFLWLPEGELTASFPALFSFISTYATRYVGLKRLFGKISDLLNEDVKTQKLGIDFLNHLNQERAELDEKINAFLKNGNDLILVSELPDEPSYKNKTVITQNPVGIYQFDASGKQTTFEDTKLTQLITDILTMDFSDDLNKSIKEKLTPEQKTELNTLLLRNKGLSIFEAKPLNEQTLVELLEFLDKLVIENQERIFDRTTEGEKAKYYAAIFFDAVFATLMAFPSLITHMQKAYDGLCKFEQLTAKTSYLSSLSTWAQWATSFGPAAVSTAFYWYSNFGLSSTLWEAKDVMMDYPARFVGGALLLGANILSAAGMKNVADGIVANPKNMFFPYEQVVPFPDAPPVIVRTGSDIGDALVTTGYPLAMGVSAAGVNSKSTFSTVFGQPAEKPSNQLRDNLEVVDLTTTFDSKNNKISKGAAQKLRSLGIFQDKAKPSSNSALEQNYRNDNFTSSIV